MAWLHACVLAFVVAGAARVESRINNTMPELEDIPEEEEEEMEEEEEEEEAAAEEEEHA